MVAGNSGDSGTSTYFDKQLTVFSPEGRVYQVEYAFNAIENCSYTSLGLRTDDAVVLMSHKVITSKLIDPEFVEHVRPIHERLGITFAGLSADCEYMHLISVHESIKFYDKYGHGFDGQALAKQLVKQNQSNSQSPRMRTLAAGILIGCIDASQDGLKSAKLIKVDPAGYEASMNAFAVGKHQKNANVELEKAFLQNKVTNVHTAIKTGISTLTTVLGIDLHPKELEIAVMTIDDDKFRKLSESDTERYLIQIEKEDE
ncbi:MAG: Proteasome subunit alpha type-6 [Marteilia pararefringens]